MNRRDFLRTCGCCLRQLCVSRGEVPACRGRKFCELAHVRSDNTSRNPEVFRGNARVAARSAHQRRRPSRRRFPIRSALSGGTARIVESKADGLGIIAAEFPAGVKPVLTLTSRVATKNYAVDLSVPGKAPKADRAELEYFRRPTKMLPTDGIVKATAD